jgi:hypothetical protein
MFFQDHEKLIYTPPGCPRSYDPVVLDRTLTVVSGNRLDALVADRNAAGDDVGDVSTAGRSQRAITSAQAELELIPIAKAAFSLPEETPAATALEYLYDFLGWLEKKGGPPGNT